MPLATTRGPGVIHLSPLKVVAAQLVLPIHDTPDSPGDAGDTVRAMLYPGACLEQSWRAWKCRTSSRGCDADGDDARWVPDFSTGRYARVRDLHVMDKGLTRAFHGGKGQIVAGSFFAVVAAFLSLVRGHAGTLGLFSVVTLALPMLTSSSRCTPSPYMLAYVYAAYHTMKIPDRRKLAKKREEMKRAKEAAAALKAAEAKEGDGDEKKEN